MGIAVSRVAYAPKPKKPGFFPFLRLHGVFWAKTRFLATRASAVGAIAKFSLLIQPHPFNHRFDEQQSGDRFLGSGDRNNAKHSLFSKPSTRSTS